MKVAFLSANQEVLPDAVIPLGLLYVMGSCPERHEKVLWDLCFERRPRRYLAERLAEFAPDVVALGMRNLQNNDYSGIEDNIAFYRSLVATIREHSDAKIVLGGGGYSVMPAPLLSDLGADFGIPGEGEEALPRLLAALESGAAGFEGIGRLHRLVDGEVVVQPPAASFLDMDALPPVDRSVVDPRYYRDYGIDSLQTKRGCPLKCDYCTYPTIEGNRGRVRDPARVADELERIARRRPAARHVFIVDSVFNLPARHAKDVCREIAARGVRMPWTCYANPLGFDAELAELMAAAGCVGMEIGSDSGADEILERLRKGFDTEKVRAISALAKAAGLKDCHTFILGTPGETMEHVHRTLDFIVDLDPFAAILMVWIDDQEVLDARYAAERRRLRESVHAVLEERKLQYPRWIIPPLAVNFAPRLFQRLRKMGMHGPLWQYIDLIDNRAIHRA